MNAVLETAVIGLVVANVATAGTFAYVLRRVAPWPRRPAPPQPGSGKDANPAGAK